MSYEKKVRDRFEQRNAQRFFEREKILKSFEHRAMQQLENCEESEILDWEEFFGSSLDITKSLLDMYDCLAEKAIQDINVCANINLGNRQTGPSIDITSTLVDLYDNLLAKDRQRNGNMSTAEHKDLTVCSDTNNQTVDATHSSLNKGPSNEFSKVDGTVDNRQTAEMDSASAECVTAAMESKSSESAINMSLPSNEECYETVNSGTKFVDNKLNYCHNTSESQSSYSPSSSYLSSSSFCYSKNFRYNCKIDKEKKRPLSISSISSTSSSSCSSLSRNGSLGLSDVDKKSYLASIESLNDADVCDDTDDDEDSCLPSRSSAQQNGSNSASVLLESTAKTNLSSSCLNGVKSKEGPSSLACHNSNTSSDETSSTKSSITCSPCKISSQLEHQDYRKVPKYWDPNLSYIERVIIEIVETERTYVEDLREIIQGYLVYMSDTSSSSDACNGRRQSLTTEQILNLFGNIEDIYDFNSSFLSELEEQSLDPVGIAKCFVKRADGFDVYTQYCTNYPRTVSLITELMRIKETAEIFRERQLTLKQSLPLGSYLLKPVQRILKYHLLLENIVKHTDEDSDGIDDIRNALSVMTNIASHINNMKRKHEHAVKVQEIQSLLYGWEGQDLTTFGELVAEGAFRMFGAKAFRHLFLFEKMLLITKKKEEMFNYKAHILCSNLMLIESIKGEPLCFHTIPFDNPRVQYTFQSRNLDQKREWCFQLKRLILENYNAVIPSHAKQIVLQLGQSNQEDGAHSSSRRMLSAPEYLERRKHDRNKSESLNHSLQKGFKLRKSLKKFNSLDSNNGSRRMRSASHDETAANLMKNEELHGRRSSLGIGSSSDERSIHSDTSKEESSSDAKSEINQDDANLLNMKVPPRTFRTGNSANITESGEDYVTFYFNGNKSTRSSRSDDSGVCSPSSSNGSFAVTAITPLSSESEDTIGFVDDPSTYVRPGNKDVNLTFSEVQRFNL